MSDAAFKTAPFPGYTTEQLEQFLSGPNDPAVADRMRAEIARRERVAAGDRSVMTPGERLRAAREAE